MMHDAIEAPTELERIRERARHLRATLAGRSVVLVGVLSPYWQCQYCLNLHQSPLMFEHKPDCILRPI